MYRALCMKISVRFIVAGDTGFAEYDMYWRGGTIRNSRYSRLPEDGLLGSKHVEHTITLEKIY
jgi:hypothetical protein